MSVWIVFVVAITLVIAVSFTDLYDNKAERQAIAETMHNPALTAMVGKGYGLNDYTFGAMMAHQMLLFTAIVVAIMSILLVNELVPLLFVMRESLHAVLRLANVYQFRQYGYD